MINRMDQGKLIVCLLFVVIIGIILVGVRQNNVCKKNVSQENFTPNCSGWTHLPKCLGDLNDWARDVGPKTELNRYCQNVDARGGDLEPGQYCVANCAKQLGKKGWIPGGRLTKNQNNKGFDWKNGFRNVPLTKQDYCKNVK